MAKKPEEDNLNESAFRQAMRGVTPINHTKITLKSNTSIRLTARKKHSPAEQDQDPFSDFEKVPAVSSEELLQFAQPGIQHKILRNLRNGKYNVEAILDLHGMTVIEARKSLSHFLLNCHRKGIRHVLMIHGKGRLNNKPILKNKLNNWLRQSEYVLAFCSATAREGSGGALYVLLKA